MLFRSSLITFIILTASLPQLVQPTDSTSPSCFCSLYGTRLEDCPCTADTVDSFNNKIHGKLGRLLEREGGLASLQKPGELVGERLGEETGTLAAVAGQTVLFLSLGEI